jgi:hypothetical protein
MSQRPHFEISSVCLPRHPAVAYLYLVRRQHIKILSVVLLTLALDLSLVLAGSEEPSLSRNSYGKITFGIRLEAIEKQLGEQSQSATPDEPCKFVTFSVYPKAKFMVEGGIVVRADVQDGVPNVLGISIGTSLSEIKKKYPSVKIEKHAYDPTGHYLIFKTKDRRAAIVMEEGEGKITAIRGGLEPAVEYVEGCS